MLKVIKKAKAFTLIEMLLVLLIISLLLILII
ncbi:prepilin-type N-terminal cleavage/methylation domain-containing protein, partial [Staphylococcus argenteus]